jgi:hypothetical protein
MNKILIILAALLIWAGGVYAQAAPKPASLKPTVVAGYTLGSACPDNKDSQWLGSDDGEKTTDVAPAEGTGIREERLGCKNSRITSVHLIFAYGFFDTQYKFLVQRYGRPLSSTSSKVQNGFGAVYLEETAIWNLPNGDAISLDMYPDIGEDLKAETGVLFEWHTRLKPLGTKNPY